jgi:hypothetical protein
MTIRQSFMGFGSHRPPTKEHGRLRNNDALRIFFNFKSIGKKRKRKKVANSIKLVQQLISWHGEEVVDPSPMVHQQPPGESQPGVRARPSASRQCVADSGACSRQISDIPSRSDSGTL